MLHGVFKEENLGIPAKIFFNDKPVPGKYSLKASRGDKLTILLLPGEGVGEVHQECYNTISTILNC